MGRALGNNLLNIGYYDEVKEALKEMGFDINFIEDQERDPALGNGGLGRLAACFLKLTVQVQVKVFSHHVPLILQAYIQSHQNHIFGIPAHVKIIA